MPQKCSACHCRTISPFDRAELWLKTVHEVFDGDKGLIEYFQKAAGYSLLGDNREQVMFICHGAGANGKSLLLELSG